MKPLVINGRQLYALVNAADLSPIRKAVFSNVLDGPPVTDSDTIWLEMVIDDIPPYNADLQTLTPVETPNVQTGQYELTYSVQDKSKEEMLKAVDRAKLEQVSKQAPVQSFTESAIIVQAAMLRALKLDLTPEEQVDADNVTAIADKLLANRVKAAADKAVVEAGGKPDTKTGWEDVAVAVAVDVGPVGIRVP